MGIAVNCFRNNIIILILSIKKYSTKRPNNRTIGIGKKKIMLRFKISSSILAVKIKRIVFKSSV